MYYRRKLILALIQAFDGYINKTDFQKLLLLLTKKQQEPTYDFVPYHFGCYSFSSVYDLGHLVKQGSITELEHKWMLSSNTNYFALINNDDKKRISSLKQEFSDYLGEKLVRYTYLNFPYYAIRSRVAEKILNEAEYECVKSLNTIANEYHLFTIGYEGLTIEAYLNKLLKNNVKLLCDVRKNALSMKYGFSKNQLRTFCISVGIEYIHIPDLGIDSDKRQELNSQEDYNRLFEKYQTEILPKRTTSIEQIIDLLFVHKRIALTCFEAGFQQCHRSKVAELLQQNPRWKYQTVHL